MNKISKIKEFYKLKNKEKAKFLKLYKQVWLSSDLPNPSYDLYFSEWSKSYVINTNWGNYVGELAKAYAATWNKLTTPFAFSIQFTTLSSQTTYTNYIMIGVRDTTATITQNVNGIQNFNSDFGNSAAVGFYNYASSDGWNPYLYEDTAANTSSIITMYPLTSGAINRTQMLSTILSMKEDYNGNLWYNVYIPSYSTTSPQGDKTWKQWPYTKKLVGTTRQIFIGILKDSVDGTVAYNISHTVNFLSSPLPGT
jgi:hypothetical protein